MSISSLLTWQWQGYPRYHRLRANLFVHIIVVPVFLLGNVTLLLAIVRGAWLAAGAHVNAVGACFRSSRELDAVAVRRARLYTDCRESCETEAGDFLIARAEGPQMLVMGPNKSSAASVRRCASVSFFSTCRLFMSAVLSAESVSCAVALSKPSIVPSNA